MGFKMKRSNMAGGIMIDKKPDGHMPDFRAKSAPLQMKGTPNMEMKDDKKKKKKKPSQEDFEPAYPGSDYSKEQIAKMTEEEKIAKIDGYTPKTKKTKK